VMKPIFICITDSMNEWSIFFFDGEWSIFWLYELVVLVLLRFISLALLFFCLTIDGGRIHLNWTCFHFTVN
jgi:hypothetical protein